MFARPLFAQGSFRTPLVGKHLPEQAREPGLEEGEIIRNVMLEGTVDRVFTTVEDIAQTTFSLRLSLPLR
jgi:3-hydroxybutyrate dehydrogenase